MLPVVCLVVLLTLSRATPATAQPAVQTVVPSVEETVVVTGGTTPVTFRELPRTVRVITREEIARLPATTVTDLVRLVASVDVRARGPRGTQADFSVRGAGFGQALVLVDGVRVNNAQTAHHNADLPVSLEDIERVEILLGPGSSAFGADAFGGTINLITRRGPLPASWSGAVGEHAFVDLGGAVSLRAGDLVQRLSGQVSRSDGFMFDREFRTLTLRSRTALGARTAVTAGFVDKAFGANGYYGASPSKEWTTLWTVGAERTLVAREGRRVAAWSSYRHHRDRFLWDVARPGLFENTHRTQAVEAGVRAQLRVGPRSDVGVVAEAAGDWISSSNLGQHRVVRAAVAADVQHRLGESTTVHAAARADLYSTFGAAASPSVGVSHWVSPGLRFRSSLGRAFRVPSFTERFYRDPVHQAADDLDPERAWAVDAAADWLPSPSWQATFGVFRRWEHDVIDWVKSRPSDLWRTSNIRAVSVSGLEAGVTWMAPGGASVRADYTWQSVDAGPLALLSKYTLDYAPRSFIVAANGPLPWAMEAGTRLEARDRTGRDPYVLTGVRLSRRLGRAKIYADVSNLFGVRYEEIRGVAMPGRWMTVGLEVGR